MWPPVLRDRGSVDGLLDQNAAIVLAPHRGKAGAKGYLSLSVSRDGAGVATQLKGYDRFGIVSPWAAAVIKRLGTGATLSSRVKGGGTIQDHILHFAKQLLIITPAPLRVSVLFILRVSPKARALATISSLRPFFALLKRANARKATGSRFSILFLPASG
jgi:hypothetical protein